MDQRLADAGLLPLPPSDDHDADTLGQIVVNWFGTPTHVHVIFRLDEPDGPNDLQVEAFHRFNDHRDVFFDDLQQQLYEYYNQARTECDLDQATIEERFPAIHNARQLASMIRLTGILIDYFDGDAWSAVIGLLAECSWEVEHGLGVKIVDGCVVEIGFQDLVI